MQELIGEHVYARQKVGELVTAKSSFNQGSEEGLAAMEKYWRNLLYPEHIAKEDKDFFYPSMTYFSVEEREKMMQEFWEFDRQLIHEKYAAIVINASTKLQRAVLEKWKCNVCNYEYTPLKGDPEHGVKKWNPVNELPDLWVWNVFVKS